MAKLLVIEHDRSLRNLLATALATHSYQHRAATSGEDGIKLAASFQPEVIILDLNLPDIPGQEVIRRVRSWTQRPILVISPPLNSSDMVDILDSGADDHITIPFSVEELLARVRVALRHLALSQTDGFSPTEFSCGSLRIDFLSATVFLGLEQVHLTPIEYKLLTLLAHNAGKVLTHSYILGEIWNNHADDDTRSLRVFMTTLRKKIEPNPTLERFIQTHIGIGYCLTRTPQLSER